jgi:chromosome segregation ATPase
VSKLAKRYAESNPWEWAEKIRPADRVNLAKDAKKLGMECIALATERDTLQRELEGVRGEVADLIKDMRAIDGCFEVALGEGWNEALAESGDERIKDIYHRRIAYAQHTAVNAIAKHEEKQAQPQEQEHG